MFSVDVSPDVMRQLQHMILQQIQYGERAEAEEMVDAIENAIAVLAECPWDNSPVKGLPAKYRMKRVQPKVYFIFQIKEAESCVKIDGIIDNRHEAD